VAGNPDSGSNLETDLPVNSLTQSENETGNGELSYSGSSTTPDGLFENLAGKRKGSVAPMIHVEDVADDDDEADEVFVAGNQVDREHLSVRDKKFKKGELGCNYIPGLAFNY
jgi:hypothetical protein